MVISATRSISEVRTISECGRSQKDCKEDTTVCLNSDTPMSAVITREGDHNDNNGDRAFAVLCTVCYLSFTRSRRLRLCDGLQHLQFALGTTAIPPGGHAKALRAF